MPKYLIIWEGDCTRQPEDYKERGQAYKQALAMVKQDIEGGLLKDWGKINGQLRGYWIVEGDEIQIGLMMEKYMPFFTFPEIYPVITFEQADEVTDIMVK